MEELLNSFAHTIKGSRIAEGITQSEKKETKKRHNYTTEFKNQIVELYHNSKMKSEIAREYSLSLSMVSRWIRQSENTGSFNEKDNPSKEEQTTYDGE